MKYSLLVTYRHDGTNDTYEHEFATTAEALEWGHSIARRNRDQVRSWFLLEMGADGLPSLVARVTAPEAVES